MSFQAARAFVDPWEGGFVNHVRDPGGATNFGITQRVYNRYRRQKGKPIRSVRKITEFEVDFIFRHDYWLPAKCDKLPSPLALVVFDGSANQGVGATARLLQVSVGAKVDGKVGPKTLAKVWASWGRDPDSLIVEFCARRARRYAGTRNMKTFGLGWFRRLCDAERAALAMPRGRLIR